MSTEQEAMAAAPDTIHLAKSIVAAGPYAVPWDQVQQLARALLSEARAASAHRAGMEEAARIADDMAENRYRVSQVAGHACASIAERIRAAKERQ